MNTDAGYHVNPKPLINLLSIGMERELESNNILNSDDIKDFFQNLIYRKVPKEASLIDTILIMLRETKSFHELVKDQSLAELLLNPATEIELLKAIKEYSKRIYQSTISKGENAVALAIYYSAIASGLVYHKEKISEHSYDTLKDAFLNLSQKAWMVPNLKDLLIKAQKCSEKEIFSNE